ncbi:hypothetical protein GCK72_003485 [Caenorhabditis remanei]|uniref:C-type lectin domain-containing protein n=1 Tax=Caenorhabditis remanei TaxID=31234 RepID=A0A6A5HUL1_CAERE|nr:hypothetical protein GCK72_003485 [Caenorhabditis remanei]KAF1771658.1 hypothetical protein GCK72_003485 [Caenorhabditis remanei]
MQKITLFIVFSLFGSIFARFDSSSESCEDSDSNSHEHGGPGNGGNNRGCGRGWHRFNRPSGGWCMRVFKGNVSQMEAESRCRREGAALSGLMNENEIGRVAGHALRTLRPLTSGSIWLGAKRTAQCSTSPISSTCTPLNSFLWTDGSTQGSSGFQWNTKQPDNNYAKTQQCVVLLASRSTVIQDQWTWNSNRLDDVACVNPGGSEQRALRGFLCGKRAN